MMELVSGPTQKNGQGCGAPVSIRRPLGDRPPICLPTARALAANPEVEWSSHNTREHHASAMLTAALTSHPCVGTLMLTTAHAFASDRVSSAASCAGCSRSSAMWRTRCANSEGSMPRGRESILGFCLGVSSLPKKVPSILSAGSSAQIRGTSPAERLRRGPTSPRHLASPKLGRGELALIGRGGLPYRARWLAHRRGGSPRRRGDGEVPRPKAVGPRPPSPCGASRGPHPALPFVSRGGKQSEADTSFQCLKRQPPQISK